MKASTTPEKAMPLEGIDTDIRFTAIKRHVVPTGTPSRTSDPPAGTAAYMWTATANVIESEQGTRIRFRTQTFPVHMVGEAVTLIDVLFVSGDMLGRKRHPFAPGNHARRHLVDDLAARLLRIRERTNDTVKVIELETIETDEPVMRNLSPGIWLGSESDPIRFEE